MKVATLVTDYVGFKRALGMRYRSEGAILNAFARSMGDIDIGEVTSAPAHAFIAGRGPLTATWHKRFSALNGLYSFALNRDIVAISPLASDCSKGTTSTHTFDLFSRGAAQTHCDQLMRDTQRKLATVHRASFCDGPEVLTESVENFDR